MIKTIYIVTMGAMNIGYQYEFAFEKLEEAIRCRDYLDKGISATLAGCRIREVTFMDKIEDFFKI